ncbi:MAG: hypothetical protein ACRDVW_10035 [Acidimicrobiales bacterium]
MADLLELSAASHLDHVGGSAAFIADARPTVVAHERAPARLARYRRSARWNSFINARQFGADRGAFETALGAVVEPDRLYDTEMRRDVGGVEIALSTP